MVRRPLLALVLAGLWTALPQAHDIPNDVTVQLLLKPEGQRLRLLVRAPLGAMRDMDYPKRPGTTNPDLLDLSRANSTLRDAATLWIGDFLDVYENGQKLPAPRVVSVRASLQSDRSFASYDEALAYFASPPLDPAGEFFWSQGLLDVFFEYPIQSDQSLFSIEPRLARLGIRTLTALRFMPPGGGLRAFEFQGEPGLVRLDPLWHQTAGQFVTLGFRRLLNGGEQLLFLLCLAIPFRRVRPLAAVVTAFVVAHSITLAVSAYNLAPDALWFPPLVDTLIATSIVYLAIENVIVSGGANVKRRWAITFGFGLAHGFGLSFALRPMLQFAGVHKPTAVLAFNAGVELGQLLVLAIAVPVLGWLFRRVVAERLGTIVLSTIVAHTAWHWMADRWAILRQFRFEWPALDALFLVATMRWMMLLVVGVGLYWLVFGVGQSEARGLKPEA